jgi:hypothetical protein
LFFWSDVARTHANELERGVLSEETKRSLADQYLMVLRQHGGEASRVVDKAPFNSDHLGLIHSVFPKARILWMRRNPLDTCLSCYFQQFSVSMNFSMDLEALADYYREHQRLLHHWREILPSEVFLEVPYEELVKDQEAWTRRILQFIGLDWDERCLDFYKTNRSINTSSAWQARQKLYGHAVDRWRNYEKFIGPLRKLKNS